MCNSKEELEARLSEIEFLGELRLTDTPGHPRGTPPKVVDDDYWPNRELGYPREPIHGDDLPRPDDEPDLPLAGDRW